MYSHPDIHIHLHFGYLYPLLVIVWWFVYLKIANITRSAVHQLSLSRINLLLVPLPSYLHSELKLKTKLLISTVRDSETELKTNRKEGTKDHANHNQTLASPLPPPWPLPCFAFFEKKTRHFLLITTLLLYSVLAKLIRLWPLPSAHWWIPGSRLKKARHEAKKDENQKVIDVVNIKSLNLTVLVVPRVFRISHDR
jgi:hypothetical protein